MILNFWSCGIVDQPIQTIENVRENKPDLLLLEESGRYDRIGKVCKIPGSSGRSGTTVRTEDSQGSPDRDRSAGTCMPSQE